jgi:hypothetical protein
MDVVPPGGDFRVEVGNAVNDRHFGLVAALSP